MTMREFWNSSEVKALFAVSVGNPSGTEYRHDTDADGEDYCDLGDTIETGLFADPEAAWEAPGVASEGKWEWSGEGNLRDIKGNSYTRLSLQ